MTNSFAEIADTSFGSTSISETRAYAFTVVLTTKAIAVPASQPITSARIPWSKWLKWNCFKLATYLDHDEDAFAELLEHKTNKDSMAERKAAESALAAATARSRELLRLYERVYEDNVNGKVTDDWFMRLSHKYEVEQEELKKQMFDLKNKLDRLNTAQSSSGGFIRAIRKFMTMQTLTPFVLQELIDKIEVFPIEGTGKNRTQRLVIHYRFVGCIDLPSIVPKHTYKLDSRQGVAIEYLPSAV